MSITMRRALEWHDSQLVSIEHEGDDAVIRLAAYVHESEGEPGVDAGAGYAQNVTVRLARATLEGDVGVWTILDGRLETGARRFENLVPLPFDADGPTLLHLEGAGHMLMIRAVAVRIEPSGPARFIELVPA